MSIYEYNEEYVRKAFYEDGEEKGYREGEETGYQKGESDMLLRAIDSIMQNLHMDLPKACESAGVSIEEYTKAKERMQYTT
ncbi:MAG: hypothetical protein NC434_14345 [Ruminococcus sp.]|nr:hypothetical protein [Ruminococcus sp.]